MAIGETPVPIRARTPEPLELRVQLPDPEPLAAPAPPPPARRPAAAPKPRAPKPRTPKHESARRRRRWENAPAPPANALPDHFYLSSPHAVPPQPADWLPASTSPRRAVPYHYATLIDHPAFAAAATPRAAAEPRVPRELKTRLKKAHGAMEVLEELERRVREFVLDERIADESESDEEEIVFIGRGKREAVVVASEEGDQAGGFARWVVHEVARYYGLRSWSVTEGGRRGVYVGRREKAGMVPPPLYALIRA